VPVLSTGVLYLLGVLLVSSTWGLWLGLLTSVASIEDRDQPGFYGGRYQGPFFTLRHDPPVEPPVVKGVTGTFLGLPITDALQIAKDAADGRNVVVLGANVAKQCLEARLLDEIIVHVAPVLVGDGVRLFEDVGREPLKLEQLSAVDDGATTILHYAVVR
jgi:hypothetical protein